MITGSQINWQRCQVLVTGGASFIGSHLVERLIQKGASVRVADNLSSGRLENLDAVQSKIEFLKGDLLEPDFAIKSSQGCKVVFHLAADHGGGGILLPILPTASTTWPSTTQYSAVLLQMASRESPSRVRPVFTPRTSRPARCSCERIWSPSRNEAVCSLMKNMAGPS